MRGLDLLLRLRNRRRHDKIHPCFGSYLESMRREYLANDVGRRDTTRLAHHQEIRRENVRAVGERLAGRPELVDKVRDRAPKVRRSGPVGHCRGRKRQNQRQGADRFTAYR